MNSSCCSGNSRRKVERSISQWDLDHKITEICKNLFHAYGQDTMKKTDISNQGADLKNDDEKRLTNRRSITRIYS